VYQFAVWINCKTDETLVQSFSRIAKYLKIQYEPDDDYVQMTLEVLQSSQCLIIFDNCNTLSMVEMLLEGGFFPQDPELCHVIITTQILEKDWPLYKMKVAQMTIQNYSNTLLMKYILGVVGIKDPTDEMSHAALQIIKEYKSFTLLMALIPQFIQQENLTLPDFVRIFQDQFVNLAPLNIQKEDVPLKIIIDSLDVKCKMFLHLLSFMNSLAGIHFFTESAFFIENQNSTTKVSELKRTVAKLTSLSLVEFYDNGQAVRIGHEWIEHYLIRSTTAEDVMLIFNNWDLLFRHSIHVERCKCEVGDIFAALLEYLPMTDEPTQIRYLNTATDCLVNWTNPRPPQVYVKNFKHFQNISLQRFIIWGVTFNEEIKLRDVVERFSLEYTEYHLHVLIASFFYGRMLSEKGQFTEALKLLDRCQTYIRKHLHPKHTFCQEILRLYGIAQYRCGNYQVADAVLTRSYFQNRKTDDTKCYLGLTKLYLNNVPEAWSIIKEFIVENIELRNRCDLNSAAMKEGLATLLQCEISLNNPFPNIIHSYTDLILPNQIEHVITLYRNHIMDFKSEEITVNKQKFFLGQYHDEPVQQYTAIASQGRIIVIYRVAQVSKWCFVYTNDFVWN
jgi:tetratricopeptide (TPR) repeat protein